MLPMLMVTIAVVLIVVYFRNTFSYWERKNIPSYPSPNLITGHCKPIFADQLIDMYQHFKQKGAKHGGFYIFHQPIYMPLDLDLLRQILTKDFDHFNEKGFYVNEEDQPIANHLFAIGGEPWKKLRMKLSPTFTSGKLKSMFPTILACAQPLEKCVRRCTTAHVDVDVKEVASKFTTDVIGSCAFGLECNSFEDPTSPFHDNGKRMLKKTWAVIIKRGLCLSFPKVCKFLRITLIPKDLETFYTNITKDTVKYREEHDVERNDFLQLLMSLRNKANPDERIDVQDIVNQSYAFYVAGFETSSTTMAFALLELARNADIQDKVRREIFDVLRKHDNETTYEAISDMKYLGQVLDETLRMYPVVVMLNRGCNRDYPIAGTDIVIEKDTKVFVPIFAIHHDADIYPEPEKFDPERFSAENKTARHPYAFLPFGEGPRQCIGIRFGYLQAKIGLATLLTKFAFTLHPSVKYPIEYGKGIALLAPEHPIVLQTTAL